MMAIQTRLKFRAMKKISPLIVVSKAGSERQIKEKTKRMLTKIILPKHRTTKDLNKIEAASQTIPYNEDSDDSLSFVSSLGSEESFSENKVDSMMQERSNESS